MLTFRYFKKHLSRRRRSVLKLLLRSVSHHNLSAEGMNNDESFSLIFAVGVSPYPRQVFIFFDECARRRYDENCLCRSILRSAERSSVSIFLINRRPIFCLPVSYPYPMVENRCLDGEVIVPLETIWVYKQKFRGKCPKFQSNLANNIRYLTQETTMSSFLAQFLHSVILNNTVGNELKIKSRTILMRAQNFHNNIN